MLKYAEDEYLKNNCRNLIVKVYAVLDEVGLWMGEHLRVLESTLIY